MYLEYDDYVNMGGTLEETAFNEFEFEAEAIVNYYTFNRLKQQTVYPQEVEMVVYALIKLAQKQDSAMTLGISGSSTSNGEGTIIKEANDGVSVEYNRIDASDLFELCKDAIPKYIERYLTGVTNELGQKLLYRGIYPNE